MQTKRRISSNNKRRKLMLREYEGDPNSASLVPRLHHTPTTDAPDASSAKNSTIRRSNVDPTSRRITTGSATAQRHREYTLSFRDEEGKDDDPKKTVVSWKNVIPLSSSSSSSSSMTSRTTVSYLNTGIRTAMANLRYRTERAMSDLFLPVGYPHSVRDGYLSYQFYDSIQGLCSYLRGVVSTSAVLTAAGVGDVEATAMSAAAQWATKDGFGMLGGLLFSYHASPHFDSHVKEFRLFADLINDVGLTLDMIAPHLPPSHLLPIASAATLCRVMCGMAAGATKGSVTQHFAVHNTADLNAKEGTQETLVSLVGMVGGVVLARYLNRMEGGGGDVWGGKGGATVVSWGVFVVLTVVHVWANYVGVMVLRLRTLNRERAEVALEDVVLAGVAMVRRDDGVKDGTIAAKERTERTAGDLDVEDFSILTPNECHESLLRSTRKLLFSGNVTLGARLSDSLPGLSMDSFHDVFEQEFCNEHYALVVLKGSVPSSRVVTVTLRVGCAEDDVLKSFIHAMIIQKSWKEFNSNGTAPRDLDDRCIVSRSKRYVDDIFRCGLLSMKKLTTLGWDDKLYLGYSRWRAQWGEDKND